MTAASVGTARLRQRCWLPTVVCLAAGLLLLAAGSANAYVVAGRAWPHGLIRYYNAFPGDAAVVRAAVDAWNHTGAKVHLVASSRRKANVIVRRFPPSQGGSSEAGFADVGWEPTTISRYSNGKTTTT